MHKPTVTDPEQLIANPSLYEPSTSSLYVLPLLGTIIGAILRNNTKERWLAGWEIIGMQARVGADIAAVVASTLHRDRPKDLGDARIPQWVQDALFAVLDFDSPPRDPEHEKKAMLSSCKDHVRWYTDQVVRFRTKLSLETRPEECKKLQKLITEFEEHRDALAADVEQRSKEIR